MSDQRSCAQDYSPGPWTVAEGMVWPRMFINGPDGSPIAMTSFDDKSEANARLIAAAPDLLAALAELLEADKECVLAAKDRAEWDVADARRCRAQRAARLAIAKAEGPQQDQRLAQQLSTESALEDGLEAEAEMRKARGEGLYE